MEQFLLRAKVDEWEHIEGKYTYRWVEGYLNLVAITEDGPRYAFVEPIKGECICHHHARGGDERYVYRPVEHSLYSKKTVSRWTGLYDKKGKKIWEGDIILDYYGRQRWVEFCDGRYLPFNAYPEYKCVSASECVVIGNRWDNPELVKGP